MRSLKDVTKKIARLKSRFLSLGGKSTLLNLVMGLFPISGSVEEKIDKLRRDFLGKATKKEEAGTWLKWKKLTLNKKHGVWALGASVSIIRMALEIQF